MDSFGLARYFLFGNDNDINQLVTAVMQVRGMNVTFYYFEGHENLLKNKITLLLIFGAHNA